MVTMISGGIAAVAPHIPLIKDVYEWAQLYLKGKDAKNRLMMGLAKEIALLDEANSQLDQHSDDLITLLNGLEKEVNRDKMMTFLDYVANYMGLYANAMQCYIDFSTAVKETVVNEDLMASLKEHNGVLFDYLHRVCDTVNEDKTLTINAELLRFFMINQERYFPSISKKETEEVKELGLHYLSIFAKKVSPSINLYVNRNRKTRRHIRRIYTSNIESLVSVQKKIQFTIPRQEFSNYIPDNLKILDVIIEEAQKTYSLTNK